MNVDLDQIPFPLRIMLVEDNEHDRVAFRRTLHKSELDCQITEYIRAEDALGALRKSAADFDVVVTDLNLPGISGLEFCKTVLAIDKDLIPMIMLTGSGAEKVAVEALKAGVTDYMIKDSSGRYRMLLPTVILEAFHKHSTRLARIRADEELRKANEQLAYLLEHFVPEKVAQRLITDRSCPKPGGEEQRMATILFADVCNFTAVAEAIGPDRVLDVLNAYLRVINKVVHQYEGSVIQYVGDLVMITFNVPEDQPDHIMRSVQTALEMRNDLEHFALQNQTAPNLPVMRFGFGVHTGPVLTGYLGAENRYVYAAVGDTTNVAFHICSRATAGQIIISQAVLDQLEGQIETVSLGTFPLKRRREAMPIYELLGLKHEESAAVVEF